MAADDRIPVSLLTGFLGSGKTTLLNKTLRAPEMADTAVVVNELGDIGLDHLLVANAQNSPDDNVVLLNAGCLCCGMLNGFKETLAELYERRTRGEIPEFKRVIVETTGLADPAPILQTLLRDSFVAHYFRLAGVVAVIDAVLATESLQHHDEAQRQTAMADVLAVSKVDQTNDEIPETLRDRLVHINPSANIVAIPNSGTVPTALMDLFRGEIETAAHAPQGEHIHGHHSRSVRADSFVIDNRVTWPTLAAWIDFARTHFGRRLLRCKGLIEIAGTGRPTLVQGVQTVFAPPQHLPAWPDRDHRSRLICIVDGIPAQQVRDSLSLLAAHDDDA
ncbi:MAG: GTP-binding protein [Rhodobacteraceae bacterium]|nr:GTP-binding protein [Paracoccaceae bacterium]